MKEYEYLIRPATIGLFISICFFLFELYILSISIVILTILGCIGYVKYIKKEEKGIDEEQEYKSFLKEIKKAFKSILIDSSEIPNIEKKILVKVNSIDALIDVSEEVKKPVYYVESTESCDFILIHNDQACVYTLKMYENSKSRLEEYYQRLNENNDNSKQILDDIDNTTIVKLGNGKSYKVSPIREKPISAITSKDPEENKKKNKQFSRTNYQRRPPLKSRRKVVEKKW